MPPFTVVSPFSAADLLAVLIKTLEERLYFFSDRSDIKRQPGGLPF